jgi:hypothetical protein
LPFQAADRLILAFDLFDHFHPAVPKSHEDNQALKAKDRKKSNKQCTRCKNEGKEDRVWKSHDWEYCFENPDGKNVKGKGKGKSEKANKAEISEDEHGFVASVSEHGMKATSQYTIWLYDTAGSIHMTGNGHLLIDLKPEQCKVNGIGPNPVYSIHIEKAVLEAVLPGGKTRKIPVSQVLYIPDLKYNLISWNVLSEKGFRADLTKGDKKRMKYSVY